MSELLPEELVTRETYDALAETWLAYHDTADFWATEMGRFQELLPEGTLLEVGAGGARDAKVLLGLGYSYVGTDVSSGLLAVARLRLPGQEFYEQSVYDLSFPDREKFDGFWASAVLLHIPKARIDEALQRIKSVVKPGGVGFISLKDGEGEQTQVDEVDGQQLERFFAYWQKDEFAEVLEANGFKMLDYLYRPIDKKTRWHCFFVQC